MIKIGLAALAILIIIGFCASTAVSFLTHAAATHPLICDTPDADCLAKLDGLDIIAIVTAFLAVLLVACILLSK